jgi:hypothetical protein
MYGTDDVDQDAGRREQQLNGYGFSGASSISFCCNGIVAYTLIPFLVGVKTSISRRQSK